MRMSFSKFYVKHDKRGAVALLQSPEMFDDIDAVMNERIQSFIDTPSKGGDEKPFTSRRRDGWDRVAVEVFTSSYEGARIEGDQELILRAFSGAKFRNRFGA